MWDFKPNSKNFVILESMITEKNTTRVIYIIDLDKKETVRLGRGHDSDVRLSDISVSRFHAIIKRDKNGKLVIKDNESKFGTLVLVQNPTFPIIKNNILQIQVGRVFFVISLKATSCLFSCLNSNISKYKGCDYQTLNSQHITFEKSNFIKVQNEYSLCGESDTNTIVENVDKDEYITGKTPTGQPIFFKEVNIDPIVNESILANENREGNTRFRIERANTNEFFEVANNITNLNIGDIRDRVQRDLFVNVKYLGNNS